MTDRAREVLWRARAETDLEEIFLHIGCGSLRSAERFFDAVGATIADLLSFPNIGALWFLPPSTATHIRSYPIRGFAEYLLFYQALEESIEIVRIVHGARDLPRHLNPPK